MPGESEKNPPDRSLVAYRDAPGEVRRVEGRQWESSRQSVSEHLGFSELAGLMSVCSTRHFLGLGTQLTEELLTLRAEGLI